MACSRRFGYQIALLKLSILSNIIFVIIVRFNLDLLDEDEKPHQQIIQGENAAAKALIDLMGSSLKLKEGAAGREGAQISVESRRPEGALKCRTPD